MNFWFNNWYNFNSKFFIIFNTVLENSNKKQILANLNKC